MENKIIDTDPIPDETVTEPPRNEEPSAEKVRVSLWGKAKEKIVKAVDQNSDGSLDLQDISIIAGTLGTAAKNTAAAMKSSADEKAREIEKKLLRPIFPEDLDSADFLMSKLVRVTHLDKRRAESEVCTGSIGYITEAKGLYIVNIYQNHIEDFGLSLYPDSENELYYVDPTDRDKYIALDDYFGFLKQVRVDELQRIAQDLGAKHFRVVYKEYKATFSGVDYKAKATGKKTGGTTALDAEHYYSASATANAEIAAEMDCPGHAPIRPKLCYLQREPSIVNLVDLRMNPTSPLSHQKYSLKLSTTSGIKEKDAVKIDAALKAMKISGTSTLTNEVQNESRRIFEYEIDF